MNDRALLFRRQFLLGPHPVEAFPSWRQAAVGEQFALHAHPDLGLTQVRRGNVELTLLGFLIDPDRPASSDEDILERLANALPAARDLFGRTARLGGRWVLIADDGRDTLLFHDPCGLRQVHYTTPEVSECWCASQTALLQEQLELAPDPEVQSAFLESPYVENAHEYWWPGRATPYREVERLTPNHFLDLRNRSVHRFWPSEDCGDLTLEEGAQQSADLLRKLVRGGNRRFDLALAITAGLDSRTLLAAARDAAPEIYYFTLTQYEKTRRSPDVRVPAKLLSRLGLSHHVIECPTAMTEAFARVYRRNVSAAHDGWGIIAQAMHDHYPPERICMKGNCAEVARLSFHRLSHRDLFDHPSEIDGEILAIRAHMDGNAFAARHFGRWLRGARGACNRHGYNLLQIFYWEQRMGSWQAMSQTEWDLVQETFTPYNCRALLETLLAVDVKHREAPHDRLFHRIAHRLWPETLSVPTNPTPTSQRVAENVMGTLRGVLKPLAGETLVYQTSRKIFRKAKAALRGR